jgi:AraC-like DNA-binding protein
MIASISILTIGFSVLSAAILLIAYVFFLKNVSKTWYAIGSCAGLLISLSALQLWQLRYFLEGLDVLALPEYRFWLFLAPPMFYFFSRATFLPDAPVRPVHLLNLLPLLLNFLPHYETAISLILLIGMGYCLWWCHLIVGLRAQRKRFRMEIFFFSLFAIVALCVLGLGMAVPYIDHQYFYVFYTNSIGFSFVLVVAALIVFPDLLMELAEAAKLSYSASTLNDIDIPASVARLDELMKVSRLYQNENLNLAMVAEAMALTPHQLSELVNREFGVNFSRFIREQRVNAVKVNLLKEPKASVLSIGLEAGFATQSSFYAAFSEIAGMSPGAYRKSMTR